MSNTENQTEATDVQEETSTENGADQSIESLQAQLAEAEARAQENQDRMLRTMAEMDNLRRRTERELESAHKFALEKFAQELLPVIDSLEMGMAAADAENVDVAKLREGSELTLKMFHTVIDKFNITAIHPLDEPFNPEHHQAMAMLEAPDKPANTVINVMQKGYLLNDRLIRPAMVVVSKASANGDATVGKNIDEQA